MPRERVTSFFLGGGNTAEKEKSLKGPGERQVVEGGRLGRPNKYTANLKTMWAVLLP